MSIRAPFCASTPLHSKQTTRNYNAIGADNFAIESQRVSYSVKNEMGKAIPIIKDCSLKIPSGQFWMLLGPNGCGKSTLLKVVMPTVEADVAFGLGRFNLTSDETELRVAKALTAVGMYDFLQRPVQTLSGGQKQRVAIAGALIEECKVLLLDELTTFLDETDQIGVIKAMKNTLSSSEDVTALWVTHRLEELEYADGAVYMEDGKVVMHGEPSIIMDSIEARKASYTDIINS
ncbi:hypothetical protein L1987_02551 [Smallanthus sonchifolius]|uniref:Uncharacterized protein n=1 Tax=Smallanthus sonchifolius TaxID=185202 RepID=A0ACB9K824_9ASTR|nr:hypothetical protein L1987_02551 [Smallanthus sonchifolius]